MPTAGSYGVRTNPASNSRRAINKFGPPESALAAFLFPFAFRDVSFWYDDFTQLAQANLSDHYTLTGGAGTAGAAFAKSNGLGGRLSGSTGTDDNEDVYILTALDWFGDNQCGGEMRLQHDVVTSWSVEIGFNDALTDTAVAAMDDVDTPSITNGAADVALFTLDTDETLQTLAFVSDGSTADMNTTATTLTTFTVPTAATYYTARVQINTNAPSGFIFNAQNSLVDAVRTHGSGTANSIEGGIPLQWRLGVLNRVAATAKVTLIDYIALWQNRY